MGSFTSQGSNAVSDAGAGFIVFQNPLNMLTQDYAMAVLLLGQASHFLKVTSFNFNVPKDATITGISAKIVKFGSILSSVSDNSVKIVKASSIVGNEKKLAGAWPIADTVFDYGSETDDWGLGWTPDDINHQDFGIAISAVAGLAATAKVGAITITIHYIGSNRAGNLMRQGRAGSGISKSELNG